MTSDYHINIFYSVDDESYIADIPDFEMCSAHGETPQEALEQVIIACDGIVMAMKERGVEPPSPRYRPAIYLVG